MHEVDAPAHSFSHCTGTLIAPQIVVTAAHCVDASKNVLGIAFGEHMFEPERFVAEVECQVRPDWQSYEEDGGKGIDFGYCILPQPVTDVPIVPVLTGCEANLIEPGLEVVLVGVGRDEFGVYGTKRAGRSEVTAIDSFTHPQTGLVYPIEELYVGGNGTADSCAGDSGGPAFVRLPDGTWRIAGVDSWALGDEHGNRRCEWGGGYGKLYDAVAWIEADSGFDVTPCHASDGEWAPGPACAALPVEPDKAGGGWGLGCAGGAVDETLVCAAGVEPPVATIVEPVSDMELQLAHAEARAELNIVVSAEDISSEVSHVELYIDGELVEVSTAPPFSFNPALGVGRFEVQAVASDWAGNRGLSQVIWIEVGVDVGASGRDDSEGSSAVPYPSRPDGPSCAVGAPSDAGWRPSWLAVLFMFVACPRKRIHSSD
jgi:hypothetical protein